MTMLILAICAGMCQINIYWGLEKQGSRGEVAVSLSPLPFVTNPQS
ncbi:MAG: hypothetical protein V7K53_04205 [Nostoc sp.]